MDDCLDDDTILDLIEGRITLRAVHRVAAHVDQCEICRRVLVDAARSHSPATERSTFRNAVAHEDAEADVELTSDETE
jgi:hypothetical protein